MIDKSSGPADDEQQPQRGHPRRPHLNERRRRHLPPGHEAREGDQPEDAHRGHIAPTPADADEMAADRAMAAAERAVAAGHAGAGLTARVTDLTAARTHEDRRLRWMRSSDDKVSNDSES